MGKLDALGDVALEAIDGLGEEGLFLVSYASEGVGGLFGTVGLRDVSRLLYKGGVSDLRRAQWERRRNRRQSPWQWHHRRGHREGRRSWARRGQFRP